MSVTMITVANFAEAGTEALHRYVEGTLPLLAQAGARVQRYGGVEALVDKTPFDLVAIMEFPSDAAMRQFLVSDAYRALDVYRNQAFSFIKTFACQAL